ncbi:MAG: tRNA lysidine(34) synthetase TilS, partial [Muribaculaceae bacterium]|nr:tRNA lysidine(34) synthetase TilS [Muribaculaceae bacterium]
MPESSGSTAEHMESRVAQFIRRTGIPAAPTTVIVGLSGGADSVALLAILVRLGYNCIAAHCNFHLRGQESDRDMLHARSIAMQLGTQFMFTEFDTRGYMADKGISLEMAARDLRYDWFRTLSCDHGNAPIAVAHHRDDNIETLMLNLLRGTGIHGLRGMLPHAGLIIRPG